MHPLTTVNYSCPVNFNDIEEGQYFKLNDHVFKKIVTSYLDKYQQYFNAEFVSEHYEPTGKYLYLRPLINWIVYI